MFLLIAVNGNDKFDKTCDAHKTRKSLGFLTDLIILLVAFYFAEGAYISCEILSYKTGLCIKLR